MTLSWVGERLGVRLVDGPPGAVHLADLAGLAVRRNPRRAHLVVSRVLGKHIPVDPRTAYAAARLLGLRVAGALGHRGRSPSLAPLAAALRGHGGPVTHGEVVRLAEAPLVIGYAETATGLGHAVADAFDGARYLHSTRRSVPGLRPVGTFDEVHSHAPEHLLLPADPGWLATPAPVVLVDDELTTGRTAAQTIRALQAIRRRRHYVVASLLDLRTPEDRAVLDATGAQVGARIDVAALAGGLVALPADVLERGRALVAALDGNQPPPDGPAAPVCRIDARWPADLPVGGRHGFEAADRPRLRAAIAVLGDAVAAGLPSVGPVLVLGTEELMYAPLMLAVDLAGRRPSVRFSATTRSPVLPVDEPGYAIRTGLEFPAHDDGRGARFIYNVAGAGFAAIVLVVDRAGDTPALWTAGGLVEALRRVCAGLTVVVLPDSPPRP